MAVLGQRPRVRLPRLSIATSKIWLSFSVAIMLDFILISYVMSHLVRTLMNVQHQKQLRLRVSFKYVQQYKMS
jgi:hypothetical protein